MESAGSRHILISFDLGTEVYHDVFEDIHTSLGPSWDYGLKAGAWRCLATLHEEVPVSGRLRFTSLTPSRLSAENARVRAVVVPYERVEDPIACTSFIAAPF